MALACPRCGARYASSARFCEQCRLPLVVADRAAEGVSAIHERARKIKPQLAEGGLVRVVQVRNQSEGEFVQGLLLEEGVPSMLRRSAGFDVPDFLAAGPRDVLVPQSGLDTAREVLLQADIAPNGSGSRLAVAPGRLLGGLLVALALGALLVWLVTVLH